MTTPRRMHVLALVQIVATLSLIAIAVGTVIVTTGNHERSDAYAERLEAQLGRMQDTNRTLAEAQDRFSTLIEQRGAVVIYLLCVNEALTGFVTLITVDPDLQSEAIRQAAVKVEAALDPDGGVCPPLRESG